MKTFVVGLLALVVFSACASGPRMTRQEKRQARRDEVESFARPLTGQPIHAVRLAVENHEGRDRVCETSHKGHQMKCSFHYDVGGHERIVFRFNEMGVLYDWERDD